MLITASEKLNALNAESEIETPKIISVLIMFGIVSSRGGGGVSQP